MEMDKISGITLNEWLLEKNREEKRSDKMFQDVQKKITK
jgi:hypothetical protein